MAVGIDIGSHSIKVAVINQGGKNPRLELFKKVKIEDDGPFEEVLGKALQKALSGLPKKSGPVIGSIPSQKAFFRELRLGFQDDEVISKVIKTEIERYFYQQSAEDVVVNYYRARELEKGVFLLVSALEKKEIQKYLDLYHSSGKDPCQLSLDLDGIFNCLSYFNLIHKDKNQIIIDLGHHTAKFMVLEKGRLLLLRSFHFRALPQWMDEEEERESENRVMEGEDSYEAFKAYHSKRLQEKKEGKTPSSKKSSNTPSLQEKDEELSPALMQSKIRGSARIKSPPSQDLEATGMFEIFEDEEELAELSGEEFASISSDHLSSFEDDLSGEWKIEDLGEEGESFEDTSFLLLDSEFLIDNAGSERVPIAVLSDEEFESLEIYDDFEEVPREDLDDLFQKIYKEVEKSVIYSNLQGDLEEILLTGGASRLDVLKTSLEAFCEVPVKIPTLPSTFTKNKDIPYDGIAAAGLAFKGLEVDATSFNFRKEEFVYQQTFEKVQKSLILTFFLVFLIFFVWFQGIRKELVYVNRRIGKIQKNQLQVYYTLFKPIAPKEKPLYPENILESVKEKEKELKREFGDSPNTPKIISSLDILKDLAQACRMSGIPLHLVSLSISQRGGQINLKVSNNESLSRIVSAFEAHAKLVQITNYSYQNQLSNIKFVLKGTE